MKLWIKKVFGFGLASFFADFSHEMTVSLVPLLVSQFVGPAQAPFYLGIIASFTELFASFLRIVSGFLTDRISRKKPLIALGYGIAAIFSALVGFAHSVWTVLVYRMFSFVGSGLREPPRDALIAATVGSENYGRAFGLRNAMDTLGSLVGPLAALMLAGIVSMRGIFALSFIPGILAVFAIIFFTEDKMVPKKLPSLSFALWKDFLLLPKWFTIFVIILFVFDVSCFNKLLLLARTQEILIDKGNIAQLLVLLYAIFNMARACGELLIGFVSDYVNRIVLLAFLGCGFFAGVALLLIKPAASFAYCVCIFIIAGISAAAQLTLKKACAADMLPENVRGLGYGVLQASEGIAALIANALIGFLWVAYSPLFGFVYVSIMSSIALVLLLGFAMLSKSRF